MYRVRFSKTAADTVKHLHPDIKKAAKKAVGKLAQNPHIGKELQHELSGYFSYRFLRYRIVYKPDRRGKVVDIFTIHHRKDVYEIFSDYLKALDDQ